MPAPGALDLTRKKAFQAMTPLDKVFMLSTEQTLDDATVSAIMASKPFSRLPVSFVMINMSLRCRI